MSKKEKIIISNDEVWIRVPKKSVEAIQNMGCNTPDIECSSEAPNGSDIPEHNTGRTIPFKKFPAISRLDMERMKNLSRMPSFLERNEKAPKTAFELSMAAQMGYTNFKRMCREQNLLGSNEDNQADAIADVIADAIAGALRKEATRCETIHNSEIGYYVRKNSDKEVVYSSWHEPERWHNPHNLTPAQVGVEDGWRLLEKEERAKLAVATNDVQIYVGGIWSTGHFNIDVDSLTYRTKKPLGHFIQKKTVVLGIDKWKHIENIWNFFAIDADGRGFLFRYKPERSSTEWVSGYGYPCNMIGVFSHANWENSLEERPEGAKFYDEFDWSDHPSKDHNFFVITRRGEGYLLKNKPTRAEDDINSWLANGPSMTKMIGANFNPKDWQNSLQERPYEMKMIDLRALYGKYISWGSKADFRKVSGIIAPSTLKTKYLEIDLSSSFFEDAEYADNIHGKNRQPIFKKVYE